MIDKQVILHGSGSGKFIQLSVNVEGREVPIFASKQKPCFHANILLEFLDCAGLDYKFTQYSDAKVPNGEGNEYRIVGAGHLVYDNDKNILIIDPQSKSTGYYVRFNGDHFEEVRSHFPEGLEVRVE